MHVSLQGPLEKLSVLGTVDLLSGKIKFPYKPLIVTHGRLELIPHRLENPGLIPIQMIEVQNGDYVEEDDIERLDDDYLRMKKE